MSPIGFLFLKLPPPPCAVLLVLCQCRGSRTHSIMRVATTASPVSGSDVREKMVVLQLKKHFARFEAGWVPTPSLKPFFRFSICCSSNLVSEKLETSCHCFPRQLFDLDFSSSSSSSSLFSPSSLSAPPSLLLIIHQSSLISHHPSFIILHHSPPCFFCVIFSSPPSCFLSGYIVV